jgi:vacuolar-type H+-ATPase subunit F/Vma7
MPAPVYIGDEVGAAGFRLAGADARIVAPGEEGAELERALASAPLVLLSAAVAARVPEAHLQRVMASLAPLVLVVPDLQGEVPLPDVGARLRRQLGMET